MPGPTVVLVHGAFADASGFAGVIRELESAGHTVLAPPNPLRGVAFDASVVSDVVKAIDGPVVLVGHSYGGAVIGLASAGRARCGRRFRARGSLRRTRTRRRRRRGRGRRSDQAWILLGLERWPQRRYVTGPGRAGPGVRRPARNRLFCAAQPSCDHRLQAVPSRQAGRLRMGQALGPPPPTRLPIANVHADRRISMRKSIVLYSDPGVERQAVMQ